MCYYWLCKNTDCGDLIHKPCKTMFDHGTCELLLRGSEIGNQYLDLITWPTASDQPCIAIPFNYSKHGRATLCDECNAEANRKRCKDYLNRCPDIRENIAQRNAEHKIERRRMKEAERTDRFIPPHTLSTLNLPASYGGSHEDANGADITRLEPSTQPTSFIPRSANVSASRAVHPVPYFSGSSRSDEFGQGYNNTSFSQFNPATPYPCDLVLPLDRAASFTRQFPNTNPDETFNSLLEAVDSLSASAVEDHSSQRSSRSIHAERPRTAKEVVRSQIRGARNDYSQGPQLTRSPLPVRTERPRTAKEVVRSQVRDASENHHHRPSSSTWTREIRPKVQLAPLPRLQFVNHQGEEYRQGRKVTKQD